MAGTEVTTGASRRPPIVPRAGRIEGPREETSLLAFVSILLNHRRLIALCTVLGMLVFSLFAAAQASMYLSRASFLVKGPRTAAQLPGGAAALGVTLAAAQDFSQSIVFYSDLVKAKSILVNVAARSYETSASKGVKRPLAEIFGIKAKSPRAGALLAAERLFPVVSSIVYSRSGTVGLAVQASDPLLAQQIATSILDELDQFSKTRRHAQAVDERKFIEGLVSDARVAMTQAEGAIGNFQRENREYESAPQLRIRNERLTREVLMRQQVYTALTQSLEQAKIEEVRDPAAITIIETADLAPDPQRKTFFRKILLGSAVGLLAGIVLAFVVQRFQEQQRGQSEAFRRFMAGLRPAPR
ncbi:MAG: GNVR domain-containing protein [Gemmatimonadales bacterium]